MRRGECGCFARTSGSLCADHHVGPNEGAGSFQPGLYIEPCAVVVGLAELVRGVWAASQPTHVPAPTIHPPAKSLKSLAGGRSRQACGRDNGQSWPLATRAHPPVRSPGSAGGVHKQRANRGHIGAKRIGADRARPSRPQRTHPAMPRGHAASEVSTRRTVQAAARSRPQKQGPSHR